MAAVSPVMVISLEISGPRRPGEPSSPARIAASLYSHNSNTNPASIGDPEPFYLLGPTFLSNKCQLGTKKVSYFFQFLPQTNFQYSGSNQALHFCSCKHICFYPKEPRHLWEDRIAYTSILKPQQQQTSKLAVESNLYWSLAADCGD